MRTANCSARDFLAGANSSFAGDKLLTSANPGADRGHARFARLGLVATATPAAGSRR